GRGGPRRSSVPCQARASTVCGDRTRCGGAAGDGRSVTVDKTLFLALNGLAGRNVWLDHLLVWSATLLPAAIVAIIVAAWFWPGDPLDRGQRQRLAVYAGIAAIVALGIAHLIGAVWFRQRPFLTLPAYLLTPHAADASFPSDHAVACFALTTPFL